MNAKQAFEEAAEWHRSMLEIPDDNIGRTDVHFVAEICFTRRAAEVEAEDAAWTAEVRRLAHNIRHGDGILCIRDARLLATLVLNVVGEKP